MVRSVRGYSMISKLSNINTYKYAANLALFNCTYLLYSSIPKLSGNDEKIVGFASQHFNGNIKYLYEEMNQSYNNVQVYFVTESSAELERLKESNVEAYHCRDIRKIPLFVKTNVWVTSHGPFYIPEYYLFSLSKKHKSKWVDLWHAVEALDGTSDGRVKMLKDYDIGIISSDFFMQHYLSKDETLSGKLKLTGFPRTDPLVDNRFDRREIMRHMRIPQKNKNILYATTWGKPAAGEKNKPFFPFENDEIIIRDIGKFCIKNDCNFIVRMHPNWERDEKETALKLINYIEKTDNVYYLPFKEYPITEPILYISDLLITDHSSIGRDFALLNRPMIYLDFGIAKGKLIPELSDEIGYFSQSKQDFFYLMQKVLDNEDEYKVARVEFIKKICKYSDGNSSQRCAEEIMKLLI
jgi:CDP-glycerol glycerophosphotransferase (TagB/SpsB family)